MVLDLAHHIGWYHPFVKLLRSYITQLDSHFFEGSTFFMCCLRYLGSFVITNFGIQGRYEHEAIVYVFLDILFNGGQGLLHTCR